MKYVTAILLCLSMTGTALADVIFIDRTTGQEVNRIADEYGDQKITIQLVGENVTSTDRTVSSTSVPSISTGGNDMCKSGVAGGLNTGVVSFSAGSTVTDETCERIKLSRELYNKGMKVASVTIMCQDPRVFEAMIQAGTPCPFEGKIGKDALEAWKRYDFERPDYDTYIEQQKKRVEETGFSEELWQRAVEEAKRQLAEETLEDNNNA